MSTIGTETVVAPTAVRPRLAPLWHVILLDDDDHTYEYVIEMLCALFRVDPRAAYAMACEVDRTGRVIVHTGVLEQAEFKREQIHGFGADPRLARSQGSMSAVLEPVPA
ncbi:MAG: ATP-dependent Clp protease adaptor ClpS [Phycisphaerales bacterium]|nr:ATP-dependent Clp protease adaptor ClpS [Phycisphaerales bacterium]